MVYRRYVDYFPEPVEPNLETRNKIAEILKSGKDRKSYLAQLRQIVDIDAAAGSARTDRTRYLAGNAWNPLGSGGASGLDVSDGTDLSSIPILGQWHLPGRLGPR
mgnify:CR=1 FL=1